MTCKMAVIFVLLFCLFAAFFQSTTQGKSQREFGIDFQNNTFVKDGVPFRYVSGSFHYSRVHPYYWEDRFEKYRAAGLNAVQTIVPWNVHELRPGEFTWSGFADLPRFLTLAQKSNLIVLLRLGPYICGEWEFGGFPAWLLTEDPKMVFRTSDPSYMKWVKLWFTELLNKVKPYLYINGGPIAMVQIENEYGSYYACDKEYMVSLRDQVKSVLGDSVTIYTTDGNADSYLKCGKTKDVYATVDFGPTDYPQIAFKGERDYEPQGPLVNSELYTGWLDHWGSPHSTTALTPIAKSLDILLAYGANINMYMFVGGTNFGFYNGANSPPYQSVPTSYDYDSPISEAGDITFKFLGIRDVISKYLPLPPSPIPSNTNKTKYGSIPMEFVCSVQDALPFLTPEGPVHSTYPVPMEQIKFYEGFILYRFILTKDYETSTTLHTQGVRDRAIVMVNGVPFGILDREAMTNVSITGTRGQAVDILVENQGRIGFSTGINFNSKGIIQNVTLGSEVVTSWTLYPLHLENINQSLFSKWKRLEQPLQSSDGKLMTPSIYVGNIAISAPNQPQDTFLDPRPWSKGQAFVNAFNIGRYWPARGPQVTLYIPKPVFHQNPALNHLFLFELESAPCMRSSGGQDCRVSLTDTPYLNGTNQPDPSSYKIPLWYNDPNLHLYH